MDGLQHGAEIGRGTGPLAEDKAGYSMNDGEAREMCLNPLEEDCPSWLCDRGVPVQFSLSALGASDFPKEDPKPKEGDYWEAPGQ